MAKANKELLTPERRKAFERLKIPYHNRAILCLDGGGMRGIMTIQMPRWCEIDGWRVFSEA